MSANAGKHKVLIVDGDTPVADALASRLNQLDHIVCGIAATSEDALNLTEYHQPDLVLIDTALTGGLDGIDTATVIRDKWDTPVVFMADDADTKKLERAKLTNPFGFLIKPFTDNHLRITTDMALHFAKVDSERILAEKTLRKNEEKYRLLAQHSLDAIWSMDLDLEFTYINEAIQAITGFTPEEWIGSKLQDHCDEENFNKMAEVILTEMAKGTASTGVVFEAVMLKKNGDPFCVEIHGKIIFDDQGQPSSIQGTTRDITDRVIKETEYSKVVGTTMDGFWLADMEGRIIDANPAMARMLGYSVEELQGLTISDIDAMESSEEIQTQIQKVIQDGGAIFEKKHKRKNGALIDVEISTSYMPHSGGRFVAFIRDITQRKLAEEALKSERDLNERVMETSPAGIVRVDTDGHVVYANKRAEDILGIAMSDNPARTYDDPAWKVTSFNGEPFPAEQLPFNVIKQTGRPVFGVQHAIEWPNGKRILLTINAAPLYDASGVFEGMVSTIEDITDRWKIKEEYETLFREMLDGFALHKIICDSGGEPIDYRFLAANPAFERMTGLKESEVRGKTVLEVLPGIEHYWIETYGKVALTGEPVYFQNYSKELDKYFEVTAFRPTPGQFACIFVDITERKRAEEALRKSEQRFSQFMQNFPNVAFIKDDQGRYVYVNRVYGTEFDPTPAERIGKTDRDIFPPEIAEMYISNDQLVWETGQSVEVVEKAVQGGEIRHQIVNKFPIVYEDGQKFIGGMTLDITDRVRAEAEKEKLQAQLLQAQKMEAVGTLAGGVAHDFNNLLQAIHGYSELLLLDKTKNDPEYPNLKAIQQSSHRASALVRQLLLFSRKTESDKRPVQLNQEVEQAIRILKRTIPKMVDIEVHPGGRLWTIVADPVQIEQILLNMGTNAADAMPDGGKFVIETQNIVLDDDYAVSHLEAQPGRYVLLTVSDTGHGISKEEMEKIFEPFFTTKEFGKGTGLGLASVYGIVRSHGGYITCYSEVGQGTTFKIYLPAGMQPDTDEELDDLPKAPPGGAETILLVDDEESIRAFARQALVKFGYTVLTASNGEEALEIYSSKTHEIDLVVMDIGMPGMGGHKCLQELIKFDPNVKVLIASGYSINGQVKNALEAGAVGYVGKPYHLHDLLNKVRIILDHKN